ncbi:TonB-dependent siderophore receptor [Steroidobacter sp.]|uniref:TonB-dependent siderophore receptor n=1 Tax=Steroidobacter sp. TaxID=1978227 RepID=UPI001A6489EA|nr:TonB-dependent receptor [Steroidobacter sp.]MBL8265269.1 TonB-dependent receptor [Steroidobacter sp.]
MTTSTLSILSAVALTTSPLLLAGTAEAQMSSASQPAAKMAISIEMLPLTAALNKWAEQTGMMVMVPTEEGVDALIASAVIGEFTAEEALVRLLGNSGYTYQFVSARTVAVEKPSREKTTFRRSDTGTSSLRLAQAEAVNEETDARNLEEVVVTSQIIFTQNDAFGATKMGLPIKDTPFSVLPITGDLIELATVRDLNDLEKLDPSGAANNRDGAAGDNRIRGFQTEKRIDGFRNPFFTVGNDLAPFDRIEIIKGGVGTLYGQTNPGGVVNFVSKLPQSTFAARLKTEAGSNDYQRVEGDLTGPLLGSDKWSYRLLAATQNDDTYLDYSRDDRTTFAPSLMYRDENSTFVLRGRYQHQDVSYATSGAPTFTLDRPLPEGMAWEEALSTGVVGLKNVDVPRSRWLSPIGGGIESDVYLGQAQYEYNLPSGWKLRSNLQYAQVEIPDRRTVTLIGPFDVEGNALSFERGLNLKSLQRNVSGELNLFGDFNLLGRDHTLFLGVDYAQSSYFESALTNRGGNFGPEEAVLNLFNPDYEAAAQLITLTDAQRNTFRGGRTDNTYFGVTTQVILKPTDRVSVFLGGRFSTDAGGSAYAETLTNRSQALGMARKLETSDGRTVYDNFSKQIAVTYAPTGKLTVYASAGESFLPSFAWAYVEGNAEGDLIESLTTESYEVGVKGQLFGALEFTLAAFDMTQDVVTDDPEHPTFSLVSPGWNNRGVELTLQGRVTPSINLFAGLAFQDMTYDQAPDKGLRNGVEAPRLGLSLFGTYEILGGPLQGLGFGAGVVHKRGRETGVESGVTNPATGKPLLLDLGDFTEVDARIFYNAGQWGVYAAGTNLLDDNHMTTASGAIGSFAFQNPGRAFRFGATYDF